MANGLMSDAAWRGEAPIGQVPADLPGEGQWPRQLVLGERIEKLLCDWLYDEISDFFVERGPQVELWNKWQRQFWAEPESKEKNFPFQRAANIVIPGTAIAVEAIHARIINTIFSVKPTYSIRPKSVSWVQAAKPFERYFQTEIETSRTLNMFNFCQDSLLELVKLGTCVGKSGYRREIKKSFRTGADGEDEPFYVETYNGATMEYVPLRNFMMRLNEVDPQDAAWCGERHTVSWVTLKRWAQAGRMNAEAIEKIKDWWVDNNSTDSEGSGSPDKARVVLQKLARSEPVWAQEFRFDEIWCSFDVNNDGYNEEIVVDYHHESNTILSIRYNWYADLHRPYRICQYERIEGLWVGLGVGKQNEQFQDVITTIHRQRLDNATLANMAQLALSKNSGYGPNEPIYPGKIWFLDDVTQIKEFKLSEVYPSAYANEEVITRISEKRTGANEMILGMQHQGTPGTATGDLARLAEGNKKYDLVFKNVKNWLNDMGQDTIMNMQQFGNQNLHYMILEAEGEYVEKILRMPPELVSRGALIELSVTDSVTNRDVEQRQWMSLFQILTSYYTQVMQIAQLMGNPEQFMAIAQRAILVADEALRRLLETFNIPDTSRFALVQETPDGEVAIADSGPTAGVDAGGPDQLEPPDGLEASPVLGGGLGSTAAFLGPGSPFI